MTDTIGVKELVEALRANLQVGQKVAQGGTVSLNPLRNIYGSGMFSYCGGNELISSLVTDDVFDTWIGAYPSAIDPEMTKVVGWIGPEGTGADAPDWDRDADCADCKGVEHGKCELSTCFGEVCQSGADLKVTDLGIRSCEQEPMLYIQGPNAGMPITNDAVWQLALASYVAKQNIERVNIIGNKTTNGRQWDGLQVLINAPVIDVRTGLRCQDSEPVLYDMANASPDDNICNVISAMVRRLRWRARFLGGIAAGDMILLMTSLMRDALIDWASCGCGPCTGSQFYSALPMINPLDSRAERARLATGGTFGMGMFEVDGIPVDILTNDWIPQVARAGGGSFCSDIFVLTRKVGALPVLFQQYQDFASTLTGVDVSSLMATGRVTDGGRFLTYAKSQNECFNQTVLAKLRLKLRAPWVQGRITNVCAPFVLPPVNAVPGDAYFFAGAPPLNLSAYNIGLPYTYGSC